MTSSLTFPPQTAQANTGIIGDLLSTNWNQAVPQLHGVNSVGAKYQIYPCEEERQRSPSKKVQSGERREERERERERGRVGERGEMSGREMRGSVRRDERKRRGERCKDRETEPDLTKGEDNFSSFFLIVFLLSLLSASTICVSNCSMISTRRAFA
jgi:hypothetical protein